MFVRPLSSNKDNLSVLREKKHEVCHLGAKMRCMGNKEIDTVQNWMVDHLIYVQRVSRLYRVVEQNIPVSSF